MLLFYADYFAYGQSIEEPPISRRDADAVGLLAH